MTLDIEDYMEWGLPTSNAGSRFHRRKTCWIEREGLSWQPTNSGLPKLSRNSNVSGYRSVGKEVRDAIRRIGGTMPENLPKEESIKKVISARKKSGTAKLTEPPPEQT
jgi:hypothetical protein